MQNAIFHKLYRYEDNLWRYVALRDLIKRLWLQYRAQLQGYTVLDAGCGTGGMINDLAFLGKSYGIDQSIVALSFSKKRTFFCKVICGEISMLPIKQEQFDFITAIDVLEHVSNDIQALYELYRVCKNWGLVILVVPAFSFLWSSRDERFEHKRRYTKREIIHKVQAANFCVLKCSYIHLFYFPVLLFFVKLKRLLGQKVPQINVDLGEVRSGLNFILKKLLSLETLILSRCNFPLGVSIVCVCRKDNI